MLAELAREYVRMERYPLAPRLAPIKAALAKLDQPVTRRRRPAADVLDIPSASKPGADFGGRCEEKAGRSEPAIRHNQTTCQSVSLSGP
jgi:hypothetical protein